MVQNPGVLDCNGWLQALMFMGTIFLVAVVTVVIACTISFICEIKDTMATIRRNHAGKETVYTETDDCTCKEDGTCPKLKKDCGQQSIK